MPQTTVAYPNTAVTGGGPVGATAWTSPGNATRDDGANASVSVIALAASQILTASDFNVLAEDAGTLFGSGIKIPADASIVGLRFYYEYSLSSGNSPVVTLAGLGHTATGVSQAMAVRSYGWGTLGAGSTVNVGSTWNGNNLTTDAGSLAARANLADPGLILTVNGTNGAGLNSAAFAVDHVRIEVQWILRKDGAGTGTAFDFGSGIAKAQATLQSSAGGRTPPTLVSYTEVPYNTNATNLVSASVSWQTGDVIVVIAASEHSNNALGLPTATGLVFTNQQLSEETNTCGVRCATAVAGSTSSGAITVTHAVNHAGMGVWVWRGSGGVGVSVKQSTTTKTKSMTPTDTRSAFCWTVADYNADTATGTLTPTPTTTQEAALDPGRYTVYSGNLNDQASGTAENFGITGGPTTGPFTIVAIEILGTGTGGGGVSSSSFVLAVASSQVTPAVPPSSSSSFATGIQKPIVSMSGSTSTSAFASAVGSLIATRSGVTTTSVFSVGSATAQMTTLGIATAATFCSGIKTVVMTSTGAPFAQSFASGVMTTTMTIPGTAIATSLALGGVTVTATRVGIATSYGSVLGVPAITAALSGTTISTSFASGNTTQVATRTGDVADAESFGSGVVHPIVTMTGESTSTSSSASGSGTVIATRDGVATSYTYAMAQLTAQVTTGVSGGGGTFPTTGVLDNFNRANGAPGAPWHPNRINSGSSIGVAIDDNSLARNGDNGWIAGPFGPDCESYCTIVIPPTSGSYIALFNRIQDGGELWDGYGLIIIEGSPWTWSLRRYDNNGGTHLLNSSGPVLAAGDMIGFEVVDSTLRAWHKPAAGVWMEVASAVDGNYSSAGGIGIEFGDNTARLDDFGGGTVVSTTGVPSVAAFGSGSPNATTNGDGIAVAYTFAQGGGYQFIDTSAPATATAAATGDQHSIATLSGAGSSNAIANGIARAYSFAISGYVYDQTDLPLEGVRVDIYRTSDHAHMGRVYTGPTGYYSLAIPTQPEVFWTRGYRPGPPPSFDTTHDNLALVESQTQGPP